ncbi:Epithelial Splicing Regulatory Protein 1 [Manis pentadactyla]|nr:Epithelial Splicing Regulatory Protein 1 [Manis pentadactyla]
MDHGQLSWYVQEKLLNGIVLAPPCLLSPAPSSHPCLQEPWLVFPKPSLLSSLHSGLSRICYIFIYFTVMPHKEGKPETWTAKVLELQTSLYVNTEFFHIAIFHINLSK